MRQLRINYEHKIFVDTFTKSNQVFCNAFVLFSLKDLNLKISQKQLENIVKLTFENFYLQINYENFNQQWLSNYFANLKEMVESFN